MTATKDSKAIQTLMIVEDEVLVSILLRDKLQKAGYKVLDLTDGFDAALEVAKAEKPHLALVNVRLARGDDGIELSKHLKGLGIPVLLISGQVSRASSAKTVAIGSMPKPYEPEEMVLAVAYLLARLNRDNTLPKPHQLEVFDDESSELRNDVHRTRLGEPDCHCSHFGRGSAPHRKANLPVCVGAIPEWRAQPPIPIKLCYKRDQSSFDDWVRFTRQRDAAQVAPINFFTVNH